MNHKPKINSQKKTWFNLYFIKNAALCIRQNKSTISRWQKRLHHLQLIPDEAHIYTSSSVGYPLCKEFYTGLLLYEIYTEKHFL